MRVIEPPVNKTKPSTDATASLKHKIELTWIPSVTLKEASLHLAAIIK